MQLEREARLRYSLLSLHRRRNDGRNDLRGLGSRKDAPPAIESARKEDPGRIGGGSGLVGRIRALVASCERRAAASFTAQAPARTGGGRRTRQQQRKGREARRSRSEERRRKDSARRPFKASTSLGPSPRFGCHRNDRRRARRKDRKKSEAKPSPTIPKAIVDPKRGPPPVRAG